MSEVSVHICGMPQRRALLWRDKGTAMGNGHRWRGGEKVRLDTTAVLCCYPQDVPLGTIEAGESQDAGPPVT